MLTDLDEPALHAYRSTVNDPVDFDAFWSGTLAENRAHPLAATFEPVDSGLATVDIFDVTFAGFGGHPIRGWLYLPRHLSGPLPGLVRYQGYGGGRGHMYESLLWASAGYAHLMMDTRGQGSSYARGATGDPIGPSGPAFAGLMTSGIENPADHYYRRLFTDAVRAVDVLREHPAVDPSRVAVV